ncbi:MAG: FRG domain-containing protein [Flavobacterium sp.]|nr:FRG domain-containing protein [Flavobacterium sp.]
MGGTTSTVLSTNAGNFVFRGLSSKYNCIKPSLYYKQNNSNNNVQEIENRLLNGFIRILKDDYGIQGDQVTSNSLDIWFIARHFHLASRFVEFTRDFLVGLQFAFEYAKESNNNAYLWALKSESNSEIKRIDSNSIDSINPFEIYDYFFVNPRLLLAKENQTKLAFDRMFNQHSIFLLQPMKWASIPVTEKTNNSSWKLFEIRQEHFYCISKEVEKKYDISMTKKLLMIDHPLDNKCKELNKIENV